MLMATLDKDSSYTEIHKSVCGTLLYYLIIVGCLVHTVQRCAFRAHAKLLKSLASAHGKTWS